MKQMETPKQVTTSSYILVRSVAGSILMLRRNLPIRSIQVMTWGTSRIIISWIIHYGLATGGQSQRTGTTGSASTSMQISASCSPKLEILTRNTSDQI